MYIEYSKISFGRHETFPLRYSWLTKGYQELVKNHKIFTSEESTVRLGVGKNMVNAIRYWLQASRLVQRSKDNGFEPNDLGHKLFNADGYDPYLEDEATIWLIHWLISTNSEIATAWFWFFNCFHKVDFDSKEAAIALCDFFSQHRQNTSVNTIKNDINILLRMYSRSNDNSRQPLDDSLDSPLSLLNLVKQAPSGKGYCSTPLERNDFPEEILGFAIAELMRNRKMKSIPIEDLMYSQDKTVAPGAIFRLTENCLLTKLECLIYEIPGIFEIRDTAGVHQLYLLDKIDPDVFLEHYYLKEIQGIAA